MDTIKFYFTFICSEKGTGDYMDPLIVAEVAIDVEDKVLAAYRLALQIFEEEYSDRMTLCRIFEGKI